MDNTRFLARSRTASRSPLFLAPGPRFVPGTFLRGFGTHTRRGLALSLAAVLLWPAVQPAPLWAQAAPPRAASPANGTAPAADALPRTDGVNVLILAFDDLSIPAPRRDPVEPERPVAAKAPVARPNVALPQAMPAVPAASRPPAQTAPRVAPPANTGSSITPAPKQVQPRDLPAIRPSSWPASRGVEYRVLAQKSNKAKNAPLKNKGLTDDDFRTEPIPLPPLRARREELDDKASPSMTGASNSGVAPVGDATGNPIAPDNMVIPGVSPNSPFALDPSASAAGASSLIGPGRAQSVAAPLRRALVRAGFADVLAVAPGNVALARAIEARSLSPRVLETARVALAKLAQAPAPAAAPATALAPATTAATAPADVASTSTASKAAETSAVASTAPAPQDKRWANLYQAAARVGQAVGYRAVIVLGVAPREATAGNGATYAMAVVDALRETGEPIAFDEEGATPAVANENAAVTAAALISRALNGLTPVTNTEKAERSASYLSWARAAYEAKDYESAQDYLSQVLAFEPTRAEARLMMADVLAQTSPEAAARAYRSALTLEGVDGASWAKAAVAFTVGSSPDWPQALAAARKALELGYESSELRQAMATAQMGRAYLFRQAGREEKADEADAEAQTHLNRALALAPDDPSPARLMATYMVSRGQNREAVRLLDTIAAQYPDDIELQTLYANALFGIGGRDEDTFAAWARVWKLSGHDTEAVDSAHYKRLSEGFDQRIATLGKRAHQLALSVSAGTSPQDMALLQMTRYKEDMDAAIAAVRVMQPSYDTQVSRTHASRVFSADLMSQAMTAYTTYLETGQEQIRTRANGLQRQAIMTLNTARTGF